MLPRIRCGGRKGNGRLAAALGVLLLPAAALPHEVFHDVERGRAVTVRAYESDGESLSDCVWEVFSPANAAAPHQRGRTDRNGYLSFVPDVPGTWRVRVVQDAGHGLDVGVEVAAGDLAVRPSGGPAAAGAAAFVLRPLVGIAGIVAICAALVAFYRRKGTGRGVSPGQ